MKTLEDLFGAAIAGEDDIDATITLQDGKLVFSLYSGRGDIGVIVLPANLPAE